MRFEGKVDSIECGYTRRSGQPWNCTIQPESDAEESQEFTNLEQIEVPRPFNIDSSLAVSDKEERGLELEYISYMNNMVCEAKELENSEKSLQCEKKGHKDGRIRVSALGNIWVTELPDDVEENVDMMQENGERDYRVKGLFSDGVMTLRGSNIYGPEFFMTQPMFEKLQEEADLDIREGDRVSVNRTEDVIIEGRTDDMELDTSWMRVAAHFDNAESRKGSVVRGLHVPESSDYPEDVQGNVYVSRELLKDLDETTSVLLHEALHKTTNEMDRTRGFQDALQSSAGVAANRWTEIDENTTKEKLQEIDGIGKTTADRIVRRIKNRPGRSRKAV